MCEADPARLDALDGLAHTFIRLKPEVRAIVKAEIRRRMAGSALEGFPKFKLATEQDPELAKEASRLIFQVIERITASTEPEARVRIGAELIPGAPLSDRSIVDPKTHQNLIALPSELYPSRADKSEKPEHFLKRVWGKLTKHHLVYAEHLRRADPHLYYALNYRAMTLQVHLSDYLFELGVMARQQISNPPKGFERQAKILRNVRTYLRAQTLSRSASQELSSGTR